MKSPCQQLIVMVGLLSCCFCSISVRANVYATDIRMNGSLNAGVILPGNSMTISYILNDTATGGVWVQIYCGTNVVKTLSSSLGAAGTNAGLNSAIWDGTTDEATNLAEGAYTVSITAASTGYADWTNITDDGTNFSVAVPRGIVVNKNTNSPFYGRVFVASTYTLFGILKYNADGSPGDEGGFSDGGLSWGSGTGFPKYSPWKMAISSDDKVYIDDFSGDGVVYAFDQTIATNQYLAALRADNYPTQDLSPQLSGLVITGTGTNAQIWMTDENPVGSAGIVAWNLTNGVAASNDTGTVIAPINPSFLSQAPYDVSVDRNGHIDVIQFITPEDNPGYALMRFSPYAGHPETIPNWAVGTYPTLSCASGVAVDPTASYIAVADVGPCDTESACGGLYTYNATNGQYIEDLDTTGGDPYYDVAWDNVGNLYTVDSGPNPVWRVYSPPGTNQARTVAVPVIQAYNVLLPPCLVNPMMCSNGFSFMLEGQSNVTYAIQCSPDLINWTAAATNFSANTNRCIWVPASNTQNFYRAATVP